MQLPETMTAVTIDRFGGPEVLRIRIVPVPKPARGQVLVRMAYIGVGTWDPLMREGVFAEITGEAPVFPMILGTDGSGTIAEVGEGVSTFAEGDEVYLMGAALYADYAVLDAPAVSRLPAGLSLEQAGAMPIAALTALHGLADELQVRPGHNLLINGASGDVGHVAVQIAKLLGARVFAVASGADGVAMARELGADVAIDGRASDITVAARELALEGFDAVLAFVAGPSLNAAISAVRDGGRIAYPLGVEPDTTARDDVTFHHFDLTLDAPAVIEAKMAKLNALIGTGPFEVRVAKSLPLADAALAHEALGKHRTGKILLSTGA